MAPIAREMHGARTIGNGEVGSGDIQLRWMGTAVAAGEERQSRQDEIGRETGEPHILIIRSESGQR